VRKFSSFARSSNSILCPSQKHCDLGDVEGPCAVLEHLWNTTVVHGREQLVSRHVFGLYVT
jgi:hypothetical protein